MNEKLLLKYWSIWCSPYGNMGHVLRNKSCSVFEYH